MADNEENRSLDAVTHKQKCPNTNLHPKESFDMSTYLAAKECPYTYLDCVATHGRMVSMPQRMPTDFSCFYNRQCYRYYGIEYKHLLLSRRFSKLKTLTSIYFNQGGNRETFIIGSYTINFYR